LLIVKLSKTLRSKSFTNIKHTHISGSSSPWGREKSNLHRHTVKALVEEDWTGSRLTYAEKEGVERIKETRDGGRAIEGRGKMERSGVGGKGGRMIWGRGTKGRGGGGS